MNDKNIRRYTADEARALNGKTDWDCLQQAGDEPGDAEFDIDWSSAELVDPVQKEPISIRIDADVLEFFRSKGRGYQSRMNKVLRTYMEQSRKS